jgi:hypothetical protein
VIVSINATDRVVCIIDELDMLGNFMMKAYITICVLYVWQALVDAPDMERVPINFKRLSLTDIKIEIKRVPKKKDLIKAMEAAGWFQIFMKSIFVLVFFC